MPRVTVLRDFTLPQTGTANLKVVTVEDGEVDVPEQYIERLERIGAVEKVGARKKA